MPKKLGDTGDFKPRKLPKPRIIGDYKPGNRFSFRVTGDKPKPDNDCGEITIPDYTRNNANVGRAQGYAVEYSGEQLENYKKQYPRFERAIALNADGKVESDNGVVNYLFCSHSSPTGYWTVTITPPSYGSFLEAGEPLFILCPIPYQITQIQSDGTEFIWEQLEGGRLAVVEPNNVIDPELIILDSIRDTRPIRFKISIKNKPEINDELVIYTTPTSFYDGFCYNQHDSPVEKSIIKASVAYTQKAYLNINPNFLGIDWFKPEQNSEYVVGYAVQENINGVFTTIQTYTLADNPKHLGKFDTSYRVVTYFDNNEFRYATTSTAFRFDLPKQITNEAGDIFENKVLFGDDNYGSQLSYNFYYNSYESVPLNVQFINPNNDVYDSKLSYGFYYNSHESLPLNVQFINPNNDEYSSKLSYSFYYNSHESFNLGGIIIA